MPGHFQIEDTFPLASRQRFVGHGKIGVGTVGHGEVATNSQGFNEPIAAVEFVLLSAAEGRENVALCFRYQDVAELGRWQTLVRRGTVLEVNLPPQTK